MMWGKLYGELIESGHYEYSFVVGKRPDLKADIDQYLTEAGRVDLIVS